MIRVRRALLSVYDKTDIVDLANVLHNLDCEIIASGGTLKTLQQANIPAVEISAYTGNPEIFGGRVKTISYQIAAGILGDRDKDAQEAEKHNIQNIDLVVCNFYPFDQMKDSEAELTDLIEYIDIGGPTMIRAAAKNYKYVTVLTDPNQYKQVMEELSDNDGHISEETRFNLMRQAFNYSADYEADIATTMDKFADINSIRLSYEHGREMRYGENPHQNGVFFKRSLSVNSIHDMKILHGKELSYNNIVDIDGAIQAVHDLQPNGCVIIKHTNPCGYAQGDIQAEVFKTAWEGDPISAFGSIIAFNTPLKYETVGFLDLDNPDKSKRKFVEVIIAPDYEKEALEYLQKSKNLRIIKYDPSEFIDPYQMKPVQGGLLVQNRDAELYEELKVVTCKAIDLDKRVRLIDFGIAASKHIKSNAIVLVRETKDNALQLLGMGAGQPNRVASVKLAIEKAKENLQAEYDGDDFESYYQQEMKKAILVSDAFFPFADSIEAVAKEGIELVVQPGGSIRDKSVIKTCDKLDVAMIFTQRRHFKH